MDSTPPQKRCRSEPGARFKQWVEGEVCARSLIRCPIASSSAGSVLLGGCESLSEGLSLLREAVASDQARIVREMEIIAFATPAWSMDRPADQSLLVSRGDFSMATAAATREGSTKGREKTGRSKSEPSSTSDLLRPTARIDQFLLMHSARLDNWREITGLAEKWQAGAASGRSWTPPSPPWRRSRAITPIRGRSSSPLLRERIAANDAAGAARLARRISNALLTRAYRERPSEWDLHAEMGADEVADVMPPGLEGSETAPALLRGPVRFGPAGRALAGARRRDAPAPPSGGRVRLRAGLRRVVRGCVLRRGRQSRAHLGRGAGGLPLPLALRCARCCGRCWKRSA